MRHNLAELKQLAPFKYGAFLFTHQTFTYGHIYVSLLFVHLKLKTKEIDFAEDWMITDKAFPHS